MKDRSQQNYGAEMNEREGRRSRVMKNKKRLGGEGLSLEVFANAKSTNRNYNPALLKKKREFYKNAKYVNKYRKILKQETGTSRNLKIIPEDTDETGNSKNADRKKKKKKKVATLQDAREEYEKKLEEQERVKMEREAAMKVKKEAREASENRRKELRNNMFKKTRSGQPVMKYRIEHILETLQNSTS